jgi:hypothetical protein
MAKIDLWEDNAGGLMLTCRATGSGWYGFDACQNEPRLARRGRDEATLATDAPAFAELEGSAYHALDAASVEGLYLAEGDANAARRVATWEAGEVEVICANGSIGDAARWYLDATPDWCDDGECGECTACIQENEPRLIGGALYCSSPTETGPCGECAGCREHSAEHAGRIWAEREAGAIGGAPSGAWHPTWHDALPLVDEEAEGERARLAEICNDAAKRCWDHLVRCAEQGGA